VEDAAKVTPGVCSFDNEIGQSGCADYPITGQRRKEKKGPHLRHQWRRTGFSAPHLSL
jgi:hypothetical protein